MIKIKCLARKFSYYFSPLNNFMGKGMDPDPKPDQDLHPDPSLRLTDTDANTGGPKSYGSSESGTLACTLRDGSWQLSEQLTYLGTMRRRAQAAAAFSFPCGIRLQRNDFRFLKGHTYRIIKIKPFFLYVPVLNYEPYTNLETITTHTKKVLSLSYPPTEKKFSAFKWTLL